MGFREIRLSRETGDFARQSLLSLCGHARKCQLRVSLFEPKLEDAQLVHSTRHHKINVFLDLWISGSGKPFETWRSSLRFSSDSIMRSLVCDFRENPNRRYGGKEKRPRLNQTYRISNSQDALLPGFDFPRKQRETRH